ncbi:MAG: WbqC family protein [Patescibacteria group bacterium]
MHILSAHQPAYLPWLGLFHKIAISDTFVVFDTVQYLNEDFNHRNRIKIPFGSMWLTVPVVTKGRFPLLLRDAQIDNSKPWQKKHLKSIMQRYSKAPYFKDYIRFFEELYSKKWDMLVPLCDTIFKYLLKEMRIHTKIIYAHQYKFQGKKSDLILDMCKQLDADLFIFGEMGQDYAKKEEYHKNRIIPYFQKYNHPIYPQLYGKFIPNLSTIDLLFNCGSRSLEIIMQGNITREDLMKFYTTER